jgi:type 1 glutamine amidotransferase
LQQQLKQMPEYRFQRVPTLEKLTPETLGGQDALLLYMHHNNISPEALEALVGYVENGSGLFALHSASASFKEETRYLELLGGHFVEHGPIESFDVKPSAEEDEIFGSISPFSVRDELYRHAYNPENHIHFYTIVDGGKEPVVWTRRRGEGRVCYCSLGHTPESVRLQPVRRIIQKGLDWVTNAVE